MGSEGIRGTQHFRPGGIPEIPKILREIRGPKRFPSVGFPNVKNCGLYVLHMKPEEEEEKEKMPK